MNRPVTPEFRTWATFTLVIAARVYRTMLLTLVAVAVLPALVTWSPYVVESGSMEPSIGVGDVAVGRPFDPADEVAVGRVYMYEDPANGADRTMVHRIVERRDDGDYTTAGDANDVTDIEPLTTDGIHARAILLVPWVGTPVVWVHTGAWGRLALWLLLTVAAFVVALRHVDGEPPRWTMLGLLQRRLRRRPPPARRREVHDRPRTPVSARVIATAVTVVAMGAAGTGVGAANATFTARTTSGGSTWQAGQWLLPYVKAVLSDSPAGFWLLDEQSGSTVADRSGTYPAAGSSYGSVQRAVEGALPNNPGTAYSFTGGRAILHGAPIAAPDAYSVELWFKTSANQAGYLIGFESTTNEVSWRYDRSVVINAQGRLEVGEWGLFPTTVTTPNGYRDGRWHHLVVTATPAGWQQDVRIYVDGTSVASGRSTVGGDSTGHWRIGGGTLPGFLGIPRAATFRGEMDAVAVYPRALTPAQVSAHYAAR